MPGVSFKIGYGRLFQRPFIAQPVTESGWTAKRFALRGTRSRSAQPPGFCCCRERQHVGKDHPASCPGAPSPETKWL
jgi:hypothetical protein